MAFPGRTCAVLALALASPIPATGDDLGAGNAEPVDFRWAIGKSWTDPAPRPGPWTPWPTDDPMIWAADACLGFYLTRDSAAFAPALPYEIVHQGLERRLYAERDDPAVRLSVFNWPSLEHGVFQCETMTWPALAKPDPEAVTAWAEARMPQAEGWEPTTDGKSRWTVKTGIARYNKELGVTVRVYWFIEYMKVEVEADYLGPPIMFGPIGLY